MSDELPKPESAPAEELDLEALKDAQDAHDQVLEEEKRRQEADAREQQLLAQRQAAAVHSMKDYQALTQQRAALGISLEAKGFDPPTQDQQRAALEEKRQELAVSAEQLASLKTREAASQAKLLEIQKLVNGRKPESIAPAVQEAMDRVQSEINHVLSDRQALSAELGQKEGEINQQADALFEIATLANQLGSIELQLDTLYKSPELQALVQEHAAEEEKRREQFIQEACLLLVRSGRRGGVELGPERQAFIRKALQVFITEDMKHLGISSVADYDLDGILEGLKSNKFSNDPIKKGLADNFRDISDLSVREQYKKRASALSKGVFLTYIFDSTFNDPASEALRRLAHLDHPDFTPSSYPTTTEAERRTLIDHIGFLNTIKAGADGNQVGAEFYPVTFTEDYNDVREQFKATGRFNPLAEQSFVTSPGGSLAPREWFDSPEGQRRIKEQDALYAGTYEEVQAQAREKQSTKYTQLAEQQTQVSGEINNLSAEVERMQTLEKLVANPQEERERLEAIQEFNTNAALKIQQLERVVTAKTREFEGATGLLNLGRRKQLKNEISEAERQLENTRSELAQWQDEERRSVQTLKEIEGYQAAQRQGKGLIPTENQLRQKREQLKTIEAALARRPASR